MGYILKIGICEGNKFDINLHGKYMDRQGKMHSGRESINYPTYLKAFDKDCFFEIEEVAIGKGFHWNKTEMQRFNGDLECLPVENEFAIVNHIDIEDYLLSVISSEMNADSPQELLKAQAVIARSWALHQILHKHEAGPCLVETENSHLRWYENDSHLHYDLCADDHCQRYYGLLRANNPNVEKAVKATANEVLTYDNDICDARYHKSCGGITERYSTCWGDIDYPYLQPVRDFKSNALPDLSTEMDFEQFILSNTPSYCNPDILTLPPNSLNDFDAGIKSYRWEQRYTVDELSELVYARSGFDFGRIISLVPLHRGASGRIDRLLIKGRRISKTIGKELEIRKFLSKSHLYSSAFVVRQDEKEIVLHGAGWGHGVGMCQTGAAAMAAQGCSYIDILKHYYAGTEVSIIKNLSIYTAK